MIQTDPGKKLLAALTLILLISFFGVSFVNYSITKSAVHSEILKNDLPLTMDNIYSDLTAELVKPILVASSMAADTFLQDWVMDGEIDPEKVQKYLLEIKEEYGFFSTFFVSSYTSNYYHFTGIHKQISPADEHDVWYYRFINSGRQYDLDVDKDEAASNVLTIFINYRLEDVAGNLLGVTGVGLRMASVADFIAKYRSRFNRNVYLADRGGVIQVHPDIELIERANIGEQEGLKEHTEEILAASADPVYFEFTRGGEKIVLNVRYIDELDWLLLVEQNESEALQTARMNFLRTVGIGLVVSGLVIFLTLVTINRYHRRVEQLAISDELTGMANRRKLEREFARAQYEHSRNGGSICLILMDLDGFKAVNDLLGHVEGDKVLKVIAGRVSEVVRPTDTLARWGGDEFALLIGAGVGDAMNLGERIRLQVESSSWPPLPAGATEDPRSRITVSCGVSEYVEEDNLDSLLLRADKALYLCKKQGGNMVERA